MMLYRLFLGVMASKSKSAHLYEPQLEAIDELEEEHGIKKSEAIRRLISEGIEARKRRREQIPAELIAQVGWAGLAGSVAAIAVGASAVGGVVAGVAAVLFVVSAAARWRQWGGA